MVENVYEQMAAWDKMCGEKVKEILPILDGLPVPVAKHALDIAKAEVELSGVVRADIDDYEYLPYFTV